MKIIVAALILGGSLVVASSQPTVVDTAYNPTTGHLYELLSNSDWLSAEATAVTLGGHLVTINDQAENDWLFNKWGTTHSLMIGATDAGHEGTFTWTSGEAFTYSHWDGGEPNNGVGYGREPENYTHMYASGFGTPGYWNDYGGGSDIYPQPTLQGVVEVPEPSIYGFLVLIGAGLLRRKA
jgi:hypothetical protein